MVYLLTWRIGDGEKHTNIFTAAKKDIAKQMLRDHAVKAGKCRSNADVRSLLRDLTISAVKKIHCPRCGRADGVKDLGFSHERLGEVFRCPCTHSVEIGSRFTLTTDCFRWGIEYTWADRLVWQKGDKQTKQEMEKRNESAFID